MNTLLSVDPGIRGNGVGCFINGKLKACAYVKSPAKTGHGPRESALSAKAVSCWWGSLGEIVGRESPDMIVLEYGQVYQRGEDRTKGDPNVVVLPLVGVVCVVAAFYPLAEVNYVQPHDWKGGLPKEDDNGNNPVELRLRERLDQEELKIFDRGIFEAKSLAHNTIDSVGIGMWGLGRFKKKRVITR